LKLKNKKLRKKEELRSLGLNLMASPKNFLGGTKKKLLKGHKLKEKLKSVY
jgi:hypothetical protein